MFGQSTPHLSIRHPSSVTRAAAFLLFLHRAASIEACDSFFFFFCAWLAGGGAVVFGVLVVSDDNSRLN